MWWGWRSPVRLHLGRGFALAQVGKGEAEVMRFPVTLPLARQLAAVEQVLAQVLPTSGKARPLHVTLSAALSPAFAFPVPPNVKRWNERLEIARGVAASAANGAPDDIACDFDSECPGVAASIPSTLLAGIAHWAGERNLELMAVAPLWSISTECGKVAKRAVRSLVVHEPDALTALSVPRTGAAEGASWPSDGDIGRGKEHAEAWFAQRGVDAAATLHLGFGAKSTERPRGLPAVFRGYWTTV